MVAEAICPKDMCRLTFAAKFARTFHPERDQKICKGGFCSLTLEVLSYSAWGY